MQFILHASLFSFSSEIIVQNTNVAYQPETLEGTAYILQNQFPAAAGWKTLVLAVHMRFVETTHWTQAKKTLTTHNRLHTANRLYTFTSSTRRKSHTEYCHTGASRVRTFLPTHGQEIWSFDRFPDSLVLIIAAPQWRIGRDVLAATVEVCESRWELVANVACARYTRCTVTTRNWF